MNFDDCKVNDSECHLNRIKKWHSNFESYISTMVETLNKLNASSIEATEECSRHYRQTVELTRAKTNFTFEVSHELKAPLASVYNIINVILDGYLDGNIDMQKEYLDRAKSRIKSIIDLLNDLLVFSRLEEGTGELETEKFEVGELFGPLMEEMNDFAGRSGVGIRWDLCRKCPFVHGNPELLRRVYANVVHNAIKYSRHGGTVEVTGARDGSTFLLRVADHGVGMKEEELEKIFDIFYRGDNTRHDNKIEGIGLGLSLVKRIVDAHDGCIRVRSELNKGTTVEVRFPALKKEGD
jgi:signal transduction histidine kinase